MILINKDFTDYSLEGYASLATLMGMVYGAEILKLDLLFMVKSEGMDHEKRQNIFKMLSNFKGGEGSKEIDLQGLLKFYRFDD